MSTAWIIVSAILAGALVLLWLRHAEVAKTLAAKSDELRSLGSRIDALGAAHTQAQDEKAVSLARLDAEISRLQTTLGAANERSEALATELQKVRESSSQATAFLSADVAQRLLTLSADVTSGLDAGEKRLVQTLTTERERSLAAETAMERRVDALAVVDAETHKSLKSIISRLENLKLKQAHDVERERKRLHDVVVRLSTINSGSFLGHRRQLNDTAVRDLVEGVAKSLGIVTTKRELAYIAHKICLLEDRCAGRIATVIETILVRVLAARHVAARHGYLSVLEIGTLFGISAGALYDRSRPFCDDIRLTLIDPLNGYYGSSERDIITGEPIARSTLEFNMARIGVPRANLTVLEGLSEDPAIRKACDGRAFNLLIIDGDHSREGVKRDFENYRELVVPDGLIAFDDYETEEWPDIKAYVDEEIAPRSDLELIAKGWRTALYRVVPPTAAA